MSDSESDDSQPDATWMTKHQPQVYDESDDSDDDDDNGDDQQQEEASTSNMDNNQSTYNQEDDDDDESEDDDDDDDNDRTRPHIQSNSSSYMTSSRMSTTSNASSFASQGGMDTSMDYQADDDDNDDDNGGGEEEDNNVNDNGSQNVEGEDENDDEDMNDGDDDNGAAADTSSVTVAAAASGKVLILPNNLPSEDDDDDQDDGGVGGNINDESQEQKSQDDNNNDDDDNEEEDDKMSTQNSQAEEDKLPTGNGATTPTNIKQPISGKPLSIAVSTGGDDGDDSSSEDELLLSHKTTKTKSTTTRKSKKATPQKQTKKKKKKSTSSTKAVTADTADTDAVATAEIVDDDAIEAVAVVDANSDSDTVEAVVIPQAPPKKKRKKPGPKPKKKPNDGKKTSSKKKGGSSTDKRKGKKRKMGNGNDSDSDGSCYTASVIPHERMQAAEAAREILMNSVQRTPVAMSDSHTVRNFGRIKIEDKKALETLYCNATALYPVGFSCDRYEFSPVHGRFLKLRCDILDGETKDETKDSANNGKQKKGPIFRIMWGRGIDELDNSQSFPFDLYSSSTPIVNEVDAVAIPAGKDTVKVKPEQGMRVKVRFENNIWHLGNILQVSVKKQAGGNDKKATTRGALSKKEKKQKYNVQILYDNGVKEDVTFPDPDVLLVAPGANDVVDGCVIDVKEVHGKPVTTILGTSPTLAWAKALTNLGLIDEIIYEQALNSISYARNEGLAELKKQTKERQSSKKLNNGNDTDPSSPSKNENKLGDVTEKETLLRERVDELMKEYETQLAASKATATKLAEARIESLGPFFSNPFLNTDTSLNQQKQWLTTIIKKEKSKIGSTGNKRKIVTATDLLERTASFYNIDIERLLEGLPGSEFCPGYVFHSLRGSASSSLVLIHEEQVRQEKEKQKSKKSAKEVKAEVVDEREKELKRKARDDEREERKKQKLEEIDQVKKEREMNRLTRLSTQIYEKLFKESCTQRERVTFLASKLIGKEVARRRKAAEIVVAHSITNSNETIFKDHNHHRHLSTLSTTYHLDVVKLWNFLTTFKGAFEEFGNLVIPSLDQLQDNIDILDSRNCEISLQKKARTLLTNIAVALCTPMTKNLIKTLSSALASALQDSKGEKVEEDAQSEASVENDPDSFPIDEFTWKEFARLTFLTDSLSDLGYTKIEQTHIIRGHRTGGHPNSKEAKRVKRGEDFALVLRRQALTEVDTRNDLKHCAVKISIPAPCKPSAQPCDWIYYLHVVKSLPSNAVTGMKSNLKKACSHLKSTEVDDFKEKKVSKNEAERRIQESINALDEIGTSITSSTETMNVCKKVRQDILNLLDSAISTFPPISNGDGKGSMGINETHFSSTKETRQKAGIYSDLQLSEEMYKKYKALKEDYISNAIKFMEDRERKKKRAEGGDVEDDDDDDDDDEEEGKLQENPIESNTNEKVERIGKETEYDDFCADEPKAPELIRRCLAVLRCLCLTSPAETFLYPVDPRANIKYYDAIMRPMSLYDVGKTLQKEAKRLQGTSKIEEVESVVAQFARSIRLICYNCSIYSSVGAAIISTAEEMIRIFERLFFDWVLSPDDILPPLNMLDDERCVVFHPSDEDSMVLLCDGCEGKFNMSRLEPPLSAVPKGDWYCPRCRDGYCWASVDPRIGQNVSKSDGKQFGKVLSCEVAIADDSISKATLSYTLRYSDGVEEKWTLDEIDDALKKYGKSVPKIRCIEAVAESPGYGCGIKNGLILEAAPIQLNPLISDTAAQQAVTSTVFQQTIMASAILLVNEIDAISSSEWLQILTLLSMKCAATVNLQEYTSKIESEAHSKATSVSQKDSKTKSVSEIIPKLLEERSASEEKVDTEEASPEKASQEVATNDSSALTGNDSGVSALADSQPNLVEAEPNPAIDEEILLRQQRKEVFSAMKERQKARENSILGYYIKQHIKSAISSFEEDNVSQVINSYLSLNNMNGIDFESSSCQSTKCSLCGLSDVALATPMVRCPTHSEWLEHMTCSFNGHKSVMIADLSNNSGSNHEESLENKKFQSKLAAVTVRVAGEIVSVNEDTPPTNDDERGIVNFLPRNEAGFQAELRARYDDRLPFVVGSLSAHECCALAAHKARIENLVQSDKQTTSSIIERTFGNTCGRTLSLGTDEDDRWYWKFNTEPDSLFVSIKNDHPKSFHKFSSPESIASVIKSLARHPLSQALRTSFPKAAAVLDDGTWSNLLQRKGFEHVFDEIDRSNNDDNGQEKESKENAEEDEIEPYDLGEDVLVESKTGELLWDAEIVAISKDEMKGKKIKAYRVHYKEWSSRFDEWVDPKRVVEPSDNNVLAQRELLDKVSAERTGVPLSLKQLKASQFMDAPNRARPFEPILNFREILGKSLSSSTCDNTLGLMRCAILVIETALPAGSVNTSSDGAWNQKRSTYWRSLVMKAEDPKSLMGCIILLENVLSKDWLRPNAEHLLSCLPRPWKAINDATVSSVALRLWVLDRGIKYGLSYDEDVEEWTNIDDEVE